MLLSRARRKRNKKRLLKAIIAFVILPFHFGSEAHWNLFTDVMVFLLRLPEIIIAKCSVLHIY